MSDAPPRGPGNFPAVTVPLAAQPAHPGMSPAPPAAHARHPATQMSPSAAPSTLESPKNPLIIELGAATQVEPRLDVTLPSNAGADDAPNGSTLRDDAARDAAIREAVGAADAAVASGAAAASTPSVRRQGPATKMSPMQMPGQSAPPGPPPAAEDAVVDAVLPPAAFLPPPPGATMDLTPGYNDGMQHAGWGPPGAHAGAFDVRDPWGGGQAPLNSQATGGGARPRANGTLVALIIGGVVVLVLGIGIIGAGMFFFSARTRAVKSGAEPALGGGSPQPASPTATPSPPATEGSPKTTPRVNDGPRSQGGTKAKLSELTANAVDVTGSRNAINAALPKIDACFVASETEPPNHESATYDLESAPNGALTRVEPGGSGAHAPRLDACVTAVLRAVRLPRSTGGGKVKITLTAPLKG